MLSYSNLRDQKMITCLEIGKQGSIFRQAWLDSTSQFCKNTLQWKAKTYITSNIVAFTIRTMKYKNGNNDEIGKAEKTKQK